MTSTMTSLESEKCACEDGEEFSEKRTKRFFKGLSYNWLIMPSTVMLLFVSELSIMKRMNLCS